MIQGDHVHPHWLDVVYPLQLAAEVDGDLGQVWRHFCYWSIKAGVILAGDQETDLAVQGLQHEAQDGQEHSQWVPELNTDKSIYFDIDSEVKGQSLNNLPFFP